jgi:hypothetical protein
MNTHDRRKFLNLGASALAGAAVASLSKGARARDGRQDAGPGHSERPRCSDRTVDVAIVGAGLAGLPTRVRGP